MALIRWDDSLSVKVAEIDEQHRRLVEMINDLNEAMRQRKGREILDEIIDGLVIYAGTHFKTEERYFDRFKYPDSRSHEDEHADFAVRVVGFKNDFYAGKVALSVEVMNFLSNWLQTHIKGSDRKYGTFFNEKGLR
jgi:hemerythrin